MLALKYRPKTFRDVVGQKVTRVTLEAMVRKEQVPTGLLFSGIRGAGKTTMGRILAAALNCEHEDPGVRPCLECDACEAVHSGSSMAVIELDAASNGNVGAIRDLTQSLRYSVNGKTRVVLLDEAHSMSTEANNALLKTLEEPPPDTVFVLLTTEPGRILGTVVSRLMEFDFVRIGIDDVVGRLTYICQQEKFDLDPELLVLIAERAQGGLRNAIMSLDQISRVGITTVEEYREFVGDLDFAPDLARAMISGSVSESLGILDRVLSRVGDISDVSGQIIRCFTDLMQLKEGGELSWQGVALESRKSLVGRVEVEKLFATLQVFWAFKTQIRVGEDQRAALELAVVMGIKALGGVTSKPAAVAPRRMSIRELAAAQ
jgi:DNA polymerase-3 subunit gamma/tau